jgi:hypothetical protein
MQSIIAKADDISPAVPPVALAALGNADDWRVISPVPRAGGGILVRIFTPGRAEGCERNFRVSAENKELWPWLVKTI